MTIHKLERVLWRLRKYNKGKVIASNFQLRRAIMFECGTCPSTLRTTRKALIELGWIKAHGTSYIRLTNADICGDEEN